MDKTPWKWVPTTYFMEGLPFTMIVVVSTIMYKNFGLSNKQITFYTGWLFIPWIIKPLWAWFIDLLQSKRWWIYTMELLIALGFVLVACSLYTKQFIFISLITFWLCAFFSASHDIATDGFYLLKLSDDKQSFFVGMQSLFYQSAKFFASGMLVFTSGILLTKTANDVHLTWFCIMLVAAIVALCLGVYHYKILPADKVTTRLQLPELISQIKQIFSAFFSINQIWIVILFVMSFRLGENMVLKIIPLFVLDSRANGGLGFSNAYIGISNIFILLAMVSAGVCGGLCINRFGLKKCLLPMLFCVNLPHAIYIFLAIEKPTHQLYVMLLQIIEYFATTFSLTAYTMTVFHLIRNSQYKTAHYAFITGIMVASIMLPSMYSGQLQQLLGYTRYFILVMFTLIPSICIVPFIKISPDFAKKSTNHN